MAAAAIVLLQKNEVAFNERVIITAYEWKSQINLDRNFT